MWRPRTPLWLFGLTSVGLALSGCVISDADDSAFVFDWGLQYVQGEAVSCDDAGTKTVTLEVEHVNTRVRRSIDFSCRDGRGVTPVLPLGPYNVAISLKDGQGRQVSAISGGVAEISRHGLTDLGTILFQIQSWNLAWSVVKRGVGPVACGQADAKTVQLVTQLGSEPQETFTFPCDDRAGITTAIRTGSYGVEVKLLNSAGSVISQVTGMTFVATGTERASITLTFEVN